MRMQRKKTICVDFDGVIYKNLNYKGTAVLNELPVDGAIDALRELEKRYIVVINSARCETEVGMEAVQMWLDKYKLPYKLSKHKPHADVYIDDRAVCFTGDWSATMDEVNGFSQWQHREKMKYKMLKRYS